MLDNNVFVFVDFVYVILLLSGKYSMWTINDMERSSCSLFLFGDAHSRHKEVSERTRRRALLPLAVVVVVVVVVVVEEPNVDGWDHPFSLFDL